MKTKVIVKPFLFSFITLFFHFYLFSQQKSSSKNIFTVVLDAGHGGKDTGNRGNNYYEKKIALSIALKTGATKSAFDATIGIHPTAAEEFVTMRVKR